MAKPKHEKSGSHPQEQPAEASVEATIPPDAQAPSEASSPGDEMTTADPGDPPRTGPQDANDKTAFENSAELDSMSTADLKAEFMRAEELVEAARAAERRARVVEDALCRRFLAAGAGKDGAPARIGAREYIVKKRPARGGGGYQFVSLTRRAAPVEL